MSNVVQFKPKQPVNDEPPMMNGHGKCMACSHEWTARVPIGTWELECPECGLWKGLMMGFVNPAEGELLRECRCGCQAFYVTPDGVHCLLCGTTQVFD